VDYNPHQYELFDNAAKGEPGSGQKQKLKSYRPVKNFVSNWSRRQISFSYESLALIIIGVIIVALVGFMLGIEQGRGLQGGIKTNITTLPKLPEDIEEEKKGFGGTDASLPAGPGEKETVGKPLPEIQPVPQIFAGPYTIQLITYSREKFARKELEKLERAGCDDSRIVEENGYYKVCAGSYATQKEANKNLRNFRRRYRDCFARLKK
jgi:hypothetical protein